MRVRAKKGMTGFIYGELRSGDPDKHGNVREFTLKPVEHSTEKDEKGDPVIITIEDQFSSKWMEKVAAKRGPKPKQDE